MRVTERQVETEGERLNLTEWVSQRESERKEGREGERGREGASQNPNPD